MEGERRGGHVSVPPSMSDLLGRRTCVVFVLPGSWSGDTSNRWQKFTGKASEPISTDRDQSGTSD